MGDYVLANVLEERMGDHSKGNLLTMIITNSICGEIIDDFST